MGEPTGTTLSVALSLSVYDDGVYHSSNKKCIFSCTGSHFLGFFTGHGSQSDIFVDSFLQPVEMISVAHDVIVEDSEDSPKIVTVSTVRPRDDLS
jgi:hypothetical protein